MDALLDIQQSLHRLEAKETQLEGKETELEVYLKSATDTDRRFAEERLVAVQQRLAAVQQEKVLLRQKEARLSISGGEPHPCVLRCTGDTKGLQLRSLALFRFAPLRLARHIFLVCPLVVYFVLIVRGLPVVVWLGTCGVAVLEG